MKSNLEAIYQKGLSEYTNFLKAAASLSRLFSNSTTPFLHYRFVENIYCRAFGAKHLRRKDISYDAIINGYGIGLKTFTIEKYRKTEKIAEFNRQSEEINRLKGELLVRKIASLRNERIRFANTAYNIEAAVYHCVGRQKNKLLLFNSPYEKVDIDKITDINTKQTGIAFGDGKNHYSYNFSKSTLYKTFEINADMVEVGVDILADPYTILTELLHKDKGSYEDKATEYVILPLYSSKKGLSEKQVPVRSGLNQWNAKGRLRDFGEVYIPVPSQVHQIAPYFFPPRDTTFKLQTPTGEILSAKLCQENSKALMTNPNKALSDWLLRGIFATKEGEIMTYKKLLAAGTDSIKIEKLNEDTFSIDFAEIDAYEKFIAQNKK